MTHEWWFTVRMSSEKQPYAIFKEYEVAKQEQGSFVRLREDSPYIIIERIRFPQDMTHFLRKMWQKGVKVYKPLRFV